MPVKISAPPTPALIPFIPELMDERVRDYHRLPTRNEAHALAEAILTGIYTNKSMRTDSFPTTSIFPNSLLEGILAQFRTARPNNLENVIRRTRFLADFFLLGTIIASSNQKIEIPNVKLDKESQRLARVIREFTRNRYIDHNYRKAILDLIFGISDFTHGKVLISYLERSPEWNRFWALQFPRESGIGGDTRNNFAIIPMDETEGSSYTLNVPAIFTRDGGSCSTGSWTCTSYSNNHHTNNGRRCPVIPFHRAQLSGATETDTSHSGNHYNNNTTLRLPSIFDMYKGMLCWGNKEDWIRHIMTRGYRNIYTIDNNFTLSSTISEYMTYHHKLVDIAYDNYEAFESFTGSDPFNNLFYLQDFTGKEDLETRLATHDLDLYGFVEKLKKLDIKNLFADNVVRSSNAFPAWTSLFRQSGALDDVIQRDAILAAEPAEETTPSVDDIEEIPVRLVNDVPTVQSQDANDMANTMDEQIRHEIFYTTHGPGNRSVAESERVIGVAGASGVRGVSPIDDDQPF